MKNKNYIAEIVCVGTELLLGQTINTNAAYLGKELANLNIFLYHQSVIGDNVKRLKEALLLALSRSDIVITTGGLGPTFDDLTKETAAELFNRRMELHQHSLSRIENIFKQMNREITPNNLKQAMMPEGAIVFDNYNGTAPALALVDEKKDKTLIMLPGPPREMRPIFSDQINLFLHNKINSNGEYNIMLSKIVNIFGIGESKVESMLSELMKYSTNPTIAPYAKTSEVELRITATGKSENNCEILIDGVIEKIKQTFGKNVYGVNAGSLENVLVNKLKEQQQSIAVAESCTGGLISKRITDISGASDIFEGGIIAYSNEVKIDLLGVSPITLEQYGAVSEQTALEMAKNITYKLNADIGISTTGIAGPNGGTDDKPVGLVFIGIYNKQNDKCIIKELRLGRGYNDERENIRWTASSNALFETIQIINN